MQKAIFVRDFNRYIDFSNIDYIYVWDADCDFKCISIFEKVDFFERLLSFEKTIVLVTPVFTRGMKQKFEAIIEKHKSLIQQYNIQIVVNSWGTFFFLKKIFWEKIEIIWGKWMYVQIKDPMAKKIENSVKWNFSIDYTFYNDFFQKNKNIIGIEAVNIESHFSLSHIKLPVHMYYPLVPFSNVKYCYSWNVFHKNIAIKVVDYCSGCEWKELKYHFDYQKERTYYKGNTFYSKNYSLENVDSLATRLVYNYFE